MNRAPDPFRNGLIFRSGCRFNRLRRMYLAVSVLCAIAFILTGQPYSRPEKYDQHTPGQELSGTVSIDNNKSKTAEYAPATDNRPPKWYASAEWWVVPIGIITFGAICWQAVEMRRATQAMSRSTRLQAAALSQWVSFENWQTKVRTLGDEHFLGITLDIVNPTTMPLTLNEVRLEIKGQEPVVSMKPQFLVPKAKYIVMGVSYPLTEKEHWEWLESGLSLIISATVKYMDARGVGNTTKFTGALYSSGKEKETQFLAQGFMIPERVAKQQNPN
jgi:hypothetical protein